MTGIDTLASPRTEPADSDPHEVLVNPRATISVWTDRQNVFANEERDEPSQERAKATASDVICLGRKTGTEGFIWEQKMDGNGKGKELNGNGESRLPHNRQSGGRGLASIFLPSPFRDSGIGFNIPSVPFSRLHCLTGTPLFDRSGEQRVIQLAITTPLA